MTTGPKTLAEAVDEVEKILCNSQIQNHRAESRLLIEHVTGVPRSRIVGFPDIKLDENIWNGILSLANRRAQHEPIAYLTGEKEFWSNSFIVSSETLIPRPDSEVLIDSVLDFIKDHEASMRILDLGSGSGCLLGALLREFKNSYGIGIEINEGASSIARQNMAKLGFSTRSAIMVGDWGQSIDGDFDIIVCNPPYIPSQDIETLDLCIKQFEPRVAIDGGEDGLAAYRILSQQLPLLLKPSGVAAVEFGIEQCKAVIQLFENADLIICQISHDLASQERCLLATVSN